MSIPVLLSLVMYVCEMCIDLVCLLSVCDNSVFREYLKRKTFPNDKKTVNLGQTGLLSIHSLHEGITLLVGCMIILNSIL